MFFSVSWQDWAWQQDDRLWSWQQCETVFVTGRGNVLGRITTNPMSSFVFCGRAGTGNRIRCLGVGSSWQSSTSGSCVFLDMAVAHDWQKIGIGLHCVCVATALWLQLFVGQGVQEQWVGFIQIVLLEN